MNLKLGRTIAAGALAAAGHAYSGVPEAARFEGHHVHYTDQGEGSALFLVHGLGADSTVFDQTIERLSDQYRVVATDLLGFGKSSKPSINYDAALYVRQIEALRVALGIERLTLIGNSMGGWISLLYAERYPERTEKLVLIAPAFLYGLGECFTADMLARSAAPQSQAEMAAYLSRVLANPPADEAPVARALAAHRRSNASHVIQSIAASIAAKEQAFTAERLQGIETPTLIVQGMEDGIVSPASSESLSTILPNAQLITMENVGHWPQREAADSFHRSLANWLD